MSVASAGALLIGCRTSPNQAGSITNDETEGRVWSGWEVTANEDLMREHGVLRGL